MLKKAGSKLNKEEKNMSVYGYVRVSTVQQKEDRQLETMKKYGIPDENIFIDKLSGKNMNRAQFQELLQKLQKGDRVVFSEISRMGRNTIEVLNTTDDLLKRGVDVVFDKERIDATTPTGKAMLGMFSTFAQLERDLMLIRQKEGIAIAKANGKYKGRKHLETDKDNLDMICNAYIKGDLTVRKAAAAITYKKKDGVAVGVSIPTFYKILDGWMIENGVKRVGYMYTVDPEVDDGK